MGDQMKENEMGERHVTSMGARRGRYGNFGWETKEKKTT
jgi:hypothetical protein